MSRLYTEMDFRNEAANAQRMQLLLSESEHGRSASVFIPQPMLQFTTRCGTLSQKHRAVTPPTQFARHRRKAAEVASHYPYVVGVVASIHRETVDELLASMRRRILVMEWVTGVKLTTLPQAELRALVAAGQQSFLTQLLEVCAHDDVLSSCKSPCTTAMLRHKLSLTTGTQQRVSDDRSVALHQSCTFHYAL